MLTSEIVVFYQLDLFEMKTLQRQHAGKKNINHVVDLSARFRIYFTSKGRRRAPCSISKCLPVLIVVVVSILGIAAFPARGLSHGSGEEYKYTPGFFRIRSQSPAYSLRMTTPHILAGSISHGVNVFTGSTVSNVWVNDDLLDLAFEMLDYSLGITYGVNHRVGFALIYDQRNYFGGVLDGLIQNFHSAMGMGQDGRDLVDKKQTTIIRYDSGGNVIFRTDDLRVLENSGITLLAQYVLFFSPDGSPAAGLSGGVRYGLEMPEGADDGDRVDWTVGAGASKRLSDNWYACLHLGYVSYGQTDILGFTLKDHSTTEILAVGWTISPRFTFLGQYSHNSSLISGLGEFSTGPHEVDLGFKWRTSKNGELEFAMIENVFTFANGPDFGLHLAYSLRI